MNFISAVQYGVKNYIRLLISSHLLNLLRPETFAASEADDSGKESCEERQTSEDHQEPVDAESPVLDLALVGSPGVAESEVLLSLRVEVERRPLSLKKNDERNCYNLSLKRCNTYSSIMCFI